MHIKPWNRLNHHNATPCFRRIAKERLHAGLEEPGSSGRPRQITLTHHHKLTVYVGQRTRPRDHPLGKPWYCQWDKQRSRCKPPEYFSDCDALMQYLKHEGYL